MLFALDIQKRWPKYKPFRPIYKRQGYIFCCVVIICEGGNLMGADCGYGGNVGGANHCPVVSPFTSTGAILVLYILLVIILSACFI